MILAWRARRKLPFHQSFRNGFSVKEKRSLDLDSGVIMGDFLGQMFPINHSCVARCSALYPPLFFEKISCLALIMGESRDSGQGPGLDQMAKRRELFTSSRTIYGRDLRHVPESRSGLIMGESPPRFRLPLAIS